MIFFIVAHLPIIISNLPNHQSLPTLQSTIISIATAGHFHPSPPLSTIADSAINHYLPSSPMAINYLQPHRRHQLTQTDSTGPHPPITVAIAIVAATPLHHPCCHHQLFPSPSPHHQLLPSPFTAVNYYFHLHPPFTSNHNCRCCPPTLIITTLPLPSSIAITVATCCHFAATLTISIAATTLCDCHHR
jgi:hypothetical protein